VVARESDRKLAVRSILTVQKMLSGAFPSGRCQPLLVRCHIHGPYMYLVMATLAQDVTTSWKATIQVSRCAPLEQRRTIHQVTRRSANSA
jgi:hypothetical protein